VGLALQARQELRQRRVPAGGALRDRVAGDPARDLRGDPFRQQLRLGRVARVGVAVGVALRFAAGGRRGETVVYLGVADRDAEPLRRQFQLGAVDEQPEQLVAELDEAGRPLLGEVLALLLCLPAKVLDERVELLLRDLLAADLGDRLVAAAAAPGKQREAESRKPHSCHPRASLWKSS